MRGICVKAVEGGRATVEVKRINIAERIQRLTGGGVKIVRADHYTFYNPMQHPEFAENGGRVIGFEGTYTTAFFGNTHPTPHHDYNQFSYKPDLADPRLGERQK